MPQKRAREIDCTRVELGGVRYVIVREAAFEQLCRRARVSPTTEPTASSGLGIDGASMAQKLRNRRHATGLTQAELARRAGVRPETLNRIERGKTTPDFATIRKLVIALNAAETEGP